MRNEYLKKQIKKYHKEGEYNIDIASLCGVSERTVYRYLKEIREEENEKYSQESDRYHEFVKAKEPRFKFISTPSHGYLLVPCDVMDKYPNLKKQITNFSWVANGTWYLEEDTDASLFMKYTKTDDKNIEHIDSKDDIGSHIMSPHNQLWDVFHSILYIRLDSYPCDARTLKQSRFVLKEFFPEIDMEKSIKYFKNHGVFCDCKIVTNMEDNWSYS